MEAPPTIALAITQTTSFIASKTFVEKIPQHFVSQLIEYNGLQDKWDLANYSQKVAAQNYINEQEQLKAYSHKYNKKAEGFIVNYIPAKHKWGRVFPQKSLGLTSFAKKTRNTLIKDLYYDFDLKNCQPEILRCICISNNIPCEVVTKYCIDRENIIAEIMTAGGVKRDLVKELVIRLSFYGGFEGWLKENDITPFPEPLIVKAYREEVSKIAMIIKAENTDLFKTMERAKKAKGETNVMGAFLSTYLQDYELRLVDTVMDYLCCKTNICATTVINHFAAVYEFDGIKLLKERVDAYTGGKDALLAKMNSLLVSIGFDVMWELKPITKYYEIEWIAPTINIVADKVSEKLRLKAELDSVKMERRMEIKLENEGFLANNDLEASKMIYAKVKDNLKYSNKIFYYKYNYRWVADNEGVKSSLGNFIRNSGIKRLNNITNTIEDYVQHRKLGQNVLNDVLDIAIYNADDEWCKTMYESSLGKILFTNGYYDFHKGEFFLHADEAYDHSIVFIEYITYDYIKPVSGIEQDYIASVKERMFIKPFGEAVADYYILNIARGLAGDVMKRVLFGVGNGNTGKSAMTASIDATCCGYCGTFNANNIIEKKMTTGDDAQQMRWVMMLLSKRIIVSNEIAPDAKISGTSLKKISSGGLDKIVGRGHGGYETEFKISFLPIIFANDLDKITPMDDAVVNRVRAINYSKVYKTTPDILNPNELLIDEGLKNEITTLEFRMAFMTLLMQSYASFVKNKRLEVEPVEIQKAFVNTFGEIENYMVDFCNDFTITDNEKDFVESSVIVEWLKEKKYGITMTKMGRELNTYSDLHKLDNVKSKAKKIQGKAVQVWIGIKMNDENC